MNSTELENAADTLHISIKESEKKQDAVPFDPVAQTERSLATFLQRSLDDALDERLYARHLKEIIDSRIGEADIVSIMTFYNSYTSRLNDREQGLLSPFIPRAGERVHALDAPKKKGAEEDVSASATKEVLQAFGELNNLIIAMKNTKGIKEALKEELGSE
jgi:hypothetical protein